MGSQHRSTYDWTGVTLSSGSSERVAQSANADMAVAAGAEDDEGDDEDAYLCGARRFC